MDVDRRINDVTQRIVDRSRPTREAYLARLGAVAEKGPHRARLSCGNLAHGFAGAVFTGACQPGWLTARAPSAGSAVPTPPTITAYNDMLSAHQPYETYPELIRAAAREAAAWRRWRAACRPCATA